MSLRIKLSIGVALVLVVALALLLLSNGSSDAGKRVKLPDGSTLLLKQTTFTSKSFSYRQDSIPKHGIAGLVARFAKLLPVRFRPNYGTASFGMGGNGGTNLYVVTINEAGNSLSWGSELGRLQIGDEQGDWYDACWGANTLGMPGETVHGWSPQAFPRRSKNLLMRFLATSSTGVWTNYAEFTIPNPAFGTFTQWLAEPWPATKTNGALAVTLKKFESGVKFKGRRATGDNKAMARKTRWEFGFTENGKETDEWRVQKLTIRDATGNKWSPYLNFDEQDFTWAKGGTAEMFGALWPGEDAWKIDLEAVRTKGFKDDEIWQTEMSLPVGGTVAVQTNSWQHDGVTVNLTSLAAPNVEHPGDLKWICKWWGEKQNETYSLGIVIPIPGLRAYRVIVLGGKDENGHDVTIVSHGSQDDSPQGLFFRVDKDATRVKFAIALPKSRTVKFLAKPKFVND
jgi:hypothetical protein